MKTFHYVLLISALIPATWMVVLTFFGFKALIANAEFSMDFLAASGSMLMGLCGYIGLCSLAKGLHTTKQLKKLVLLTCGVLGFTIFMLVVSPRNFVDWISTFSIENLIGKWPLIVSIYYIILLVNELIKGKQNQHLTQIS